MRHYPLRGGIDLETFLPDRWLATHPQHRWTISDLRQEERTAKGRLQPAVRRALTK